MSAVEARKLDLLVWGATGFTGSLVAEYLVSTYGAKPKNFTWGIGGRSATKLEAVKEHLKAKDPLASDIPVVTGDSLDEESLIKVARSTRVIVTTAGPYAIYGSKLVEACIKEGTHYADLTGEVLWMHEMIKKHHSDAAARKVKIVHTCGFDSIPSDMGAFMMVDWIQKNLGKKTRSVKMIFSDVKGGVSGGTIASVINQVKATSHGPTRRLLEDPYTLNPPEADKPSWDTIEGGFGYEPVTKRWTSPFVMSAINVRVVRRSNALTGNGYGAPFSYTETQGKTGVIGLLLALMTTFITLFIKPVLSWGPTRRLAMCFLPAPGQGPSEELREHGYFWADLVAETAPEGPEDKPVTVTGRVGTHLGDPGYKETAHMLAESGLALALQEPACPANYGVLTPAVAMGPVLLDRLRSTGMTFEVHGTGSKGKMVSEGMEVAAAASPRQ